MRINTNTSSMIATRNYGYHQQRVANCIYRLSSGKRINSAADDPAGMAIAQRLKTKLRDLDVRIRDTEYTQAMLDTAYSEAAGRQDILGRLNEIAIQVSGDTLSWNDKNALMSEFNELAKELSISTFQQTGMEIVSFTSGQYAGEVTFKKGDSVYISGEWMRLDKLDELERLSGTEIEQKSEVVDPGGMPEIKLPENSDSSKATIGLIDYVKGMINGNLSSQAGIGAAASALSFRLNRLHTEEANATEALSRIEDADFAKELTELVKESVLSQCALAVAAQANALPENVLYLMDKALDNGS